MDPASISDEAKNTSAGEREESEKASVRESVAPGDERVTDRILRDAASRTITFRGFHSDSLDTILFIFCGISGVALVATAKFTGLTGWPAEFMVIAIIVLYALLCWRSRRFNLHPERLGDNCYYMGFIFTLASLAAALVAIQFGDESARGSLLEELLGGFGVALFSTIVGIIARVSFMQMHREVEDIEAQLRLELQSAAAHLKDQLMDAVFRLEGFRVRTAQVIEEQSIKSVEEVKALSDILMAKLSDVSDAHASASEQLANRSEEVSSALIMAVETISKQMKTSVGSYTEVTKQLSKSADKVVGEVGRLVTKIDSIEVPSDLLTRQVEDVRAKMTTVADAFEAVATGDRRRQEAFEAVATRLDQLLQKLGKYAPFDTITDSTARLAETIERTQLALSKLDGKLRDQAVVLTTLTNQATADAATIAEARNTTRADLTEATASLHKLQSTLADVAEQLVVRLGSA
ncbi:MAG: hypothetical protein ACU0B1_09765 [Thermohalobaculum sp.]